MALDMQDFPLESSCPMKLSSNTSDEQWKVLTQAGIPSMYISDRKMRIMVGGKYSELVDDISGVPQGSVYICIYLHSIAFISRFSPQCA